MGSPQPNLESSDILNAAKDSLPAAVNAERHLLMGLDWPRCGVMGGEVGKRMAFSLGGESRYPKGFASLRALTNSGLILSGGSDQLLENAGPVRSGTPSRGPG
jgi:hypothetical protein